uniref:Uncharacterized protein n=1 Tax=viral metagenome TaxID=1070528 RepID=A0A6M3Y213_9ZZZZ
MFSNRIANSARFLQMPIESQLLYFHMILRADDDGVVESYPVMKLLGVTPDNFKILVVKRFIEQLNEDQVIIICDWLEHNRIRADRKKDSIYKHLIPKETILLEPKPRSDVKDNSNRIGGQSTGSVSKGSIGKGSIGKGSIGKGRDTSNDKSLQTTNQLIELFKPLNPVTYKKWYSNTTQRKAVERLNAILGEKLEIAINTAIQANSLPYAPTITTPLQLEEKLSALRAFVLKEQLLKKGKQIIGL